MLRKKFKISEIMDIYIFFNSMVPALLYIM